MNPSFVNEMKDNPVFAMSLHSKELFHSNFWAWLFEHNIEYARIFFPDIDRVELVTREEGHRDITIWNGKYLARINYHYKDAYVIENKFKSIPNLEQIKEYESKLGSSFRKGVITGIIKPDFIDNETNWSFLSYLEICDAIEKVVNTVKETGFVKTLILEYVSMFRKLSAYIKAVYEECNNKWITAVNLDYLVEMRMDDVVKKYKATELELFLKNKLSILPETIGNYKKVICSDYSHGSSIVDIRYVVDEKMKKKADLSVIGVQIQGNNYRLCIQKEIQLSTEKQKEFFNEYLSKKWFELYNPDDCVIFGHETDLKDDFRKFGGEGKRVNYTFLYQYWIIKDETYDTLADCIVKDMSSAIELIK